MAKRRELEALLTEAEVAEALARPSRTLRQWRYLGTGPRYFKVGMFVRYKAADVEAWIEAQARETSNGAR